MPKWDRHSILAEVHRRGATLTGLAVRAGIEPSACRVAMSRRHKVGERIISEFLGIPVSELWPDRYRADSGTTRRRRARRRSSRARSRKTTRTSNRRKVA